LDEKKEWCIKNNIHFYKCNICDEFSVESIIKQEKIDTIVNFAAESHVDVSIKTPNIFFESNIMGTVTLLNLSKKYNLRFHQISTDEVYGETTPHDWLVLDDYEYPPLKPSSPYSSSKASAELIALSYYRTFGTNITISRCSNNFGPYQHTEKLIPTVINKILKEQNIPVYGEGNQKRHWIYVDEHNRAIMNILEKGIYGTIYNIAPLHDNYITNIELIKFILEYTKKSLDLIEHVPDRLGHDVSYYMEANYDFCNSNKHWKDDMIKTINWYTDKITNTLI
jgi:dTDP-glucose 4,6-dehydratase